MIRAGVLAVLAVGCGSTRTSYVVSLEVRGRELLVEKCAVDRTSDEVRAGDCFIERHAIPMPVERGQGGTP